MNNLVNIFPNYYFNNIFIIWILFLIFTSLIGLFKQKNNIILFFINLELSILGISLLFIFSSILINNYNFGQIIALFILTLAACESSIGLSILIIFFKLKNSISTKKINSIIC